MRIARTIQRDDKGEQTAENIAKVKQQIAAQHAELLDELSIGDTKDCLFLCNDGATPIPLLAQAVIDWGIGKALTMIIFLKKKSSKVCVFQKLVVPLQALFSRHMCRKGIKK